jgi:hypothetical protein
MGRLKVNKKGWETLKKRLLKFDERKVDVGFFRKEKYGAENDNLYVAEVAWMNDQGTSIVPPRPFMTVDFYDYASDAIKEDAKRLFSMLLFQKNVPYLKELQKIGDKYRDQLKEIIYDYPGHNSPWWAEYKGFDDPLFHTGTLAEAVESRIV